MTTGRPAAAERAPGPLGNREPAHRKDLAVVAALCVAAAAAAAVVARGRMAASADSVTYIGAADSLLAGDGLGTWLESPLAVFPPAWPLAIAAVGRIVGDTELAAALLVALSVLLTPLLGWRVLARCTDERVAQLLGAVALGVSPIVLSWSFMGLSEVPFVALLLGCILAALRSVDGRRWLLPVAVGLAAVAPLVRYAGVGVPLALAIWIGLVRPGGRSWLAGAGAAVASLAPLSAVAIWNSSRAGSAFGPRVESQEGALAVVGQGVSGLGRTVLWGLGANVGPIAALLGVALVAASPAAVLGRAGSAPDDGRSARILVALMAVVQWAVMVASRIRADFDVLGPRLLAPTAVLALLLTLALVGDARRSPSQVLRTAVVAGAALWCLVGVAVVARSASQPDVNGYYGPSYVSARSAADLARLPDRCRTATSDPVAEPGCLLIATEPWAWYDSELRPAASPRAGEQEGVDLEVLARRIDAGDEVYLLWTPGRAGSVAGPEQLDRALGLDEVGGQGSSLRIYRVGGR